MNQESCKERDGNGFSSPSLAQSPGASLVLGRERAPSKNTKGNLELLAKGKKPDAKDHILDSCIYMECTE